MENIKNQFEKKLKNLSDDKLIQAINQNVGISAWGNARALYLTILKQELLNRQWDCSSIIFENHFSLAKKVVLIKKKIIFAD